MPALLVRLQVREIDTWRQVFREEAETRRSNGALHERHFLTATTPGDVWLLIEWDDLFRAELFVQSDDLRAALIRGGVIGQPSYWYLEDADPGPPPQEKE